MDLNKQLWMQQSGVKIPIIQDLISDHRRAGYLYNCVHYPDQITSTEDPVILEEQDEFITLIIVVVVVIIAIIMLFSMGVFLDCRHQHANWTAKQRKKLHVPPVWIKNHNDDIKSLASNAYPLAIRDLEANSSNVVLADAHR